MLEIEISECKNCKVVIPGKCDLQTIGSKIKIRNIFVSDVQIPNQQFLYHF